MKKLAVVVHVLQTTQNLVDYHGPFDQGFTQEGKEMYQES